MSAEKVTRRVLVVDDDPHLLNLLEIRLSGEGFAVTVASSAQEALKKTSEQPPNIVIADIMMPGMDGYELCSRIRENKDLRNIPFVFLSALADTEDKVRGLRLGADDYLTKPFEFHELLARIEILLDRYERYQATFDREEDLEITTSGKIEDLGIIDLLQMLSFGQKTGEVTLESGSEKGALYLMAGRLIAAKYRNKEGFAALPTLLSWSEGRFSVRLAESLSVIPTIQNQTDEAIFEALRELDEAERLKQELDPASIPVPKGSPEPSDEVESVVLELSDGKRTITEILADAPAADLDVLEKLRDLVNKDMVELRKTAVIQEETPAVVEEKELWPADSEPRAFNIIVIGANRDARNSFIRSAAGLEESEDPEGKVLNFGRIQQGPYQLNLYGLPGAKRFAPLWQTFMVKVQGILLLAAGGAEEELDVMRFALSLLQPRIQGPTFVINTDPTHPGIKVDEAKQNIKIVNCLPSDRQKAQGIITDLIKELIR